jgi:hypothetical protein
MDAPSASDYRIASKPAVQALTSQVFQVRKHGGGSDQVGIQRTSRQMPGEWEKD